MYLLIGLAKLYLNLGMRIVMSKKDTNPTCLPVPLIAHSPGNFKINCRYTATLIHEPRYCFR